MLKTRFSISEVVPVSLILGMEVIRAEARGTLKLSPHNYVKSLLEKFGMDLSNPVHTPGIPDQLPHLSGAEHKIRHCKFIVSQVARPMGKPHFHRLAAVERVFRYLEGKPDLPLSYSSSDKGLDLTGDFQAKMRSTTDTMFVLADELVYFSSSLQRITATSTTEAEFMALSKWGKFGTYLFNLRPELG
ncbi:unnamed protein product, partial [Sphacelaria rigidula]